MDRLKGKVALISGGARGQGAAEVRLFVNEGARVVIGDVLDAETRALADEVNRRAGSRVTVPIHLDVTRAVDWRAAVDTCEREFGGLHILVNNAGILNTKGVSDTSEEEWDAIINVNQKGVWLGTKIARARNEEVRQRIDHQYLVHLWINRFGRLRRLSRQQRRGAAAHQNGGGRIRAL